MLPSESRVRRGEEFARATRAGRRSGRAHLVAYLATEVRAEIGTGNEANASTSPHGPVSSAPARAGFVVSKAVGNAVVRNRVRRRLRHLCADRLAGLPAGSILVVRALPPAAAASSAALGRELDAALKRLTAGRGS